MNGDSRDTFGEGVNIASSTECTGLMPALPESMEEDRDMAEMYRIHSAKKDGKKRRTK